MAGVIGVDDINMTIRAEVAAGNRTVEVAIVVDNSGSMATSSGRRANRALHGPKMPPRR